MKKQEMGCHLALVGQLTRGQWQELFDKLKAQSNAKGIHRSARIGGQPIPGVPTLKERAARAQRNDGLHRYLKGRKVVARTSPAQRAG